MSAQDRNGLASPGPWGYWAALLGAALVATVAPWYLGVVDIDVRPTLRALLTGGALALALMQLDVAKRTSLVAAPHVLGVLVLGAAWYLLGTFDVTGFLILFAVPVFAVALECGRWTVLGIAVLTVAVAGAAALTANPELRWQLLEIDALVVLLPRAGEVGDVRFASSAAARAQLATLAVFAATTLAVAGVGSSVASVIRRQARTLQQADRAHRESASLVSKLLDDSSAMEAIVSPGGRLHSVNRAFRDTFGEPGAASHLVDLIRPLYPEALTQLVAAGDGGFIAAQTAEVNGKPWLLDVDAQPVMIDGEPMRRVRLRPTPRNDLAAAALDELRIPLLILAPDRTVAFANQVFRSYFPAAAPGAGATAALESNHGLPARWWDIAPSATAQVRFVHDGRRCVARIVLKGALADSALTSIEIRAEDAR